MDDRSIEVSAPDVQEAIRRGLALLGLDEEEASVEILDQGSRGLFGLGARDATVRLTPKGPATAMPSIDVQERSSASEPRQAPELPREPAPPSSLGPGDVEPSAEGDQAATPTPEPEYAFSQTQIGRIAQQTVTELLAKMGMDCQVVIRQQEPAEDDTPPVTLDVLGENADDLIGRQGETLDALQYISRLIVSREVEHWVNLVIDIGRYKQRRAKSLGQLAERIADHVARTQQPVALEPMPPNERRIIHLTLHDHPAVTTQSVGRGDSRKVTIIPRR
jgi:spoIIIJ-associated protein